LIAGLAVVLIGGAAIGWIVFARDDDNARPVVAATPADPPVVKSVAPPVAPAKPVVTTTTAEIASLEHPALGEIASPVSGEVASVFLTGPTTVAVGDKLFAIRSVSGGTNTAALTKRIAELEVLVEKDPTVYEPFLSRAKRDLSRAKPQVAITAVNATVAGLIDTGVKPGTHVQAGSVLGTVRDARTWTAVAVVRGIKPRPNWSCAVATRDDSHVSVCTIETTEASPDVGGDVRVTVEIAANKASWLEGLDQHPRLVLDPPQAP
jgi:biotin carboxyl carrier protein